MNGVNLETGKRPLRERSPFIDVPMINCSNKAEADKFFDEMEARPSPRLIKTHYPFEFLPPNLLETCKVTPCLVNPSQQLLEISLTTWPPIRCFMCVVTSKMHVYLISTTRRWWRAMTWSVTLSPMPSEKILSFPHLEFHTSAERSLFLVSTSMVATLTC